MIIPSFCKQKACQKESKLLIFIINYIASICVLSDDNQLYYDFFIS
jgi:hypothetical protein